MCTVCQVMAAFLSDLFVCRLEGLLYATGVAYSESAGVLLDSNVLDLALAFTDSVPLLNASMFTVTGPTNMSTTKLQTVDSSDAYYTFSVTVPDDYYGSITVAMDKVCFLTEALKFVKRTVSSCCHPFGFLPCCLSACCASHHAVVYNAMVVH